MSAPRAIQAGEFDLALTLDSGQIFHAFATGTRWQVLAGCHLLEVEQGRGVLLLHRGDPEVARHYLALDHPMPAIYRSFPDHAYATEALDACRGMRILRQPKWECLATFLTSAMKRVSHIRAMSLALRARFGEPVRHSLVPAYPSPERLAAASEDALLACGLGFRARHMLATARLVAGGAIHLDSLARLPTPALREALCKLPGVGRKIANCALLFAYGRMDAVPVDVWIGRIASALRGRRGPAITLERYAARRFGPYAGYVQQYLFHHARTTGKLPTR